MASFEQLLSNNQMKGIALTKNIVFGFIRNQQTALSNSSNKNNAYYTIPKLVKYLILIYYYMNERISVYGKSLKYDEIKNIITKRHDKSYLDVKPCTAYGTIDINGNYEYYMIYECNMYIGIDSSNKKHVNNDFLDEYVNKNDFYCLILHHDIYIYK